MCNTCWLGSHPYTCMCMHALQARAVTASEHLNPAHRKEGHTSMSLRNIRACSITVMCPALFIVPNATDTCMLSLRAAGRTRVTATLRTAKPELVLTTTHADMHAPRRQPARQCPAPQPQRYRPPSPLPARASEDCPWMLRQQQQLLPQAPQPQYPPAGSSAVTSQKQAQAAQQHRVRRGQGRGRAPGGIRRLQGRAAGTSPLLLCQRQQMPTAACRQLASKASRA